MFGLILFLYPSMPVFAGEIVVWGNSGASQDAPHAGSDFISIAAGEKHSIALRSNGTMVTWEEDENSGAISSLSSFDSDYVAIATLVQHSLALRADGTIIGWGRNWFGESDPPPGNNYAAVATGVYHSLALRNDGSIFVWGGDVYGEGQAPAGNGYIAVAGGYFYSLALRADGSIYAWGSNELGQLNVPAGNDFVAIASGVAHGLALRKNGTIAAWGYNEYGQATAPAGNDFVAIACGAYHSLALRADGSVVAWGKNDGGQTNLPEDNNGFVAIAGGFGFSMALRSAEPLSVQVSIDIKPGEYPNSVNPKSMGVLPVAILGSGSFEAADVDPATVTLNGAGVKAAGKSGKLMVELIDVNGDGLDDLLCYLDSRGFSAAPGDTVAVLQGSTSDGIPIVGEDTIRIVGR
jgi:hypothetical protein